jgi:hypothetical protein
MAMPLPERTRLSRRRPAAPAVAVLGVLIAGACATRSAVPSPSPESIRSLEARLQAEPGSPDSRFDLALAYRAAGRPADASATLEPLAASGDADAAALFLLALSYEQQQRFGEARRTYDAYLEAGGTRRLDRRARARLALLERLELQAAARDAISREQALAATSPDPATIGIFPFLFAGAPPALQPLGRAFAELLTTDLAVTGRLTVVERVRVQLLLDELSLAASATVDPATAARTGRFVGAGRLIQGRLEGDSAALRIQALVVSVASPTSPATLDERSPLADLLEAEKRLALSLYSSLGIQLTVAERERVLLRHTDNVQALLAFAAGIEADDAGRWADAVREYQRALDLDSGFALARVRRDEAQLRWEAEQEGADALAELAERDLGWDLPGWLRRRLVFGAIDRLIPEPDLRDPVPELFGVEGLDRRARVNVIIRPPAGG